MRKLSCSLLLLSLLVLVAAQAQAQEDPYVGHYSCTGDVQSTCGSCPQWRDPLSSFTIDIKAQESGTYEFCVSTQDYPDCNYAAINDGKVEWPEQEFFDGITRNSMTTAEIKDGKWIGTEKGELSGACTCTYSVAATCSK